jgi:hypothetical protein
MKKRAAKAYSKKAFSKNLYCMPPVARLNAYTETLSIHLEDIELLRNPWKVKL